MAAPVWLLSVDLQAKTATFVTGMSDAAKAARASFQDIGQSAEEGGHRASGGVMNVRASLGLLDNTIRGNHAAAMADLVHLFSQSQAVMAALPFAATAGGFLLLGGVILEAVNKYREMKEEQEKLSREMTDFGTAAQNSFNSLDEKLLEAGKRADELRNDHLSALAKELKLIDAQSLDQLGHAFDELAKKTDVVFDELKQHWYSFGIGSDGAKHALEVFKSQYDSLLSSGNGSGAAGLLTGTLSAAQKVLALQKEAQANSGTLTHAPGADADLGAGMRAQIELKKSGVGFTDKEIEAQELLVAALRDQQTIQEKMAGLKKEESENATKATGNAAASRSAEAQRAAAESMLRMGQQAIQADRAVAEAQLSIHRASLEARLASDIEFAGRERDVQLAGNEALINALNKSNNDYANQLKALKGKKLEINSEYDAKVAELSAKASIAEAERDLTAIRQTEREKIEATDQGSSERLAAIDSAIRAEKAAHLEDTNFYRELLNQRVETLRQETEEESKLRAEAAKEAADSDEKMGMLSIAAFRQHYALLDSERHVSAQKRIDEESEVANAEFAVKMAALEREAAGLDKTGKDYDNKLRERHDKEKQLIQEHANEIANIKIKAEEESNQRILAAEDRRNDAMARGLTQSIMGHQSWSKTIISLGDQVISGMIENAVKSMLIDDMDKERDAAHAARKAFNIGIGIGGPAGLILGPVFAAGAFASVMAFNQGTDSVPGFGNSDTVPAMLTPREGVVPGGVMDGLRNVARNGGFTGGTTVHLHHRPTYHVQTIDGDGIRGMLQKHSEEFTKHVNNQLRKMNR